MFITIRFARIGAKRSKKRADLYIMNELLKLFLSVTAYMFIFEMGDKTQLALVAMTQKYKPRDIMIGVAGANIVLNLLAVTLGSALGSFIPLYIIKAIGALAFFYFAFTVALALARGGEEEEKLREGKSSSAIAAVFGTFFLAELGDKTQIAAISFASQNVDFNSQGAISAAIVVFFACSIGLFASDMLGFLVGYLLKKNMPERLLSIISFLIFTFCGFFTSHEAIVEFDEALKVQSFIAAGAITVVFLAICAIVYLTIAKKRNSKK